MFTGMSNVNPKINRSTEELLVWIPHLIFLKAAEGNTSTSSSWQTAESVFTSLFIFTSHKQKSSRTPCLVSKYITISISTFCFQ